MPSKKWQTSRSISSNKDGKSRGKGSGLTEKGKRRRPGSPPHATVALPILSNPVLQRSNSRASNRYTTATMATLLHSRALRPTSPARASSPRNLRPRSRSLPVPLASAFDGKKKLRRLTLANTSSLSRILFDCKNKENTPLDQESVETKDASQSSPIQKPSLADRIAGEMKTPEFHSTPSVDSPQFPALPPSESKDHTDTHALNIEDPTQNDNCEILLAKRFDVLLPHAGPPTRFVGIDIDDTVVITNHAPSILLTTCGVTAFQRFVHQKFSDFKTKNSLCRDLEKAVKEKVLVEPNIPSVIRDLQDSGCWVFGVTARYHEMAASTDKCLSSLGINLSLTSPFPSQILRDPKTGAVCVNGIIYCNGLSKGTVLNRFFENVVLRSVLQSKNKATNTSPLSLPSKAKNPPASTTSSISVSNSSSGTAGLPERFIFIDDQRSQAECICKDLRCARTLNIPVTCFHFVPEMHRDPCELLDRQQRGTVLMKQMLYFIEKKIVLSNQEAIQLLKVSPSNSITGIPRRVELSSVAGITTGLGLVGSSSSTHESVVPTRNSLLSGVSSSTIASLLPTNPPSVSRQRGETLTTTTSAPTAKVARLQQQGGNNKIPETKLHAPR